MLTEDMKRIVREQPLGYVATIAPDGAPSVSPKGSFVVLDDATIAFGEIRSPGTARNLRTDPRVEVNFIDPFVRKGYRFVGTATVIARGETDFEKLHAHFHASTLAPRMRAIVSITIRKAMPLMSPVYDDGVRTEPEIRRGWTTRFRKVQPGEKFEE